MQGNKIEFSEELNDLLLDNCSVHEIEQFYDFLEDVLHKSVYWYVNDSIGRKEVKLYFMGKMKVSMRYEFTPIRKRISED
jgi:hypothetical protein